MYSTCASGSSDIETDTCERLSGWHSGIKSEVRLAAMMPAMRAAARTLPFAFAPSCRAEYASGPSRTVALATALRAVSAFAETSTIVASPRASTCVSGDELQRRRERCATQADVADRRWTLVRTSILASEGPAVASASVRQPVVPDRELVRARGRARTSLALIAMADGRCCRQRRLRKARYTDHYSLHNLHRRLHPPQLKLAQHVVQQLLLAEPQHDRHPRARAQLCLAQQRLVVRGVGLVLGLAEHRRHTLLEQRPPPSLVALREWRALEGVGVAFELRRRRHEHAQRDEQVGVGAEGGAAQREGRAQ
eukprot:4317296-Prymnesium_polylepis.1